MGVSTLKLPAASRFVASVAAGGANLGLGPQLSDPTALQSPSDFGTYCADGNMAPYQVMPDSPASELRRKINLKISQISFKNITPCCCTSFNHLNQGHIKMNTSAPRTPLNFSITGANPNEVIGNFTRAARANGWTNAQVMEIFPKLLGTPYADLLCTLAGYCTDFVDE